MIDEYDLGAEAFENGDTPDKNPYLYGSDEFYEWMRGYSDASRGLYKESV